MEKDDNYRLDHLDVIPGRLLLPSDTTLCICCCSFSRKLNVFLCFGFLNHVRPLHRLLQQCA